MSIEVIRVTSMPVPDHQCGWALVERDDGVTYRLSDDPMTGVLPHDLVPCTVERTLARPDGIWGAVAAGVVFHGTGAGRIPPAGGGGGDAR